jgi:hypothetical protein
VKLQEILSRFITLDRLKEVAHGMDTQVNESFNNTFSWLAPTKNKVYCGSQSLKNRLCIGIGINALGTHEYFNRLYKTLGIIITDNIVHFLDQKEKKRLRRRIAKTMLTDTKKNRLMAKHEKLRLDTAIAQKEPARREGTYRTGQNMDHVDEEMNDTDAKNRPPNSCPFCHLKGHKTKNSRKCLFYSGNKNVATTADNVVAAAVLAEAAVPMHRADARRMDNKSLQDDPPSDLLIDEEEFQDCDTWEDDGGLLKFGDI